MEEPYTKFIFCKCVNAHTKHFVDVIYYYDYSGREKRQTVCECSECGQKN